MHRYSVNPLNHARLVDRVKMLQAALEQSAADHDALLAQISLVRSENRRLRMLNDQLREAVQRELNDLSRAA
jgi:regulator of replication initiation timing